VPALFPAETVICRGLLVGARDISAVFYVKIQIGGKFLVEKLINSMNIY
jgi:hypothetical protein